MGSRHACMSFIFITFRLYENVCRDFFHPIPAKRDLGSLKRDPAKAGQFLSCYADFANCPGEIVPGKTFSCTHGVKKTSPPSKLPTI